MYTSVLQRTRDIGVMKAIGATREDIRNLFLIESGLLGLAGGVIGTILGILLSQMVEYVVVNFAGFQLLTASYSWYLIVGALTFSVAIGMISGTAPAVRASR
ncbi:MAG: ABC transporter permease, partial [Halobacteriaceae archaeon]